jgi:long-chain fatty acid transport protein
MRKNFLALLLSALPAAALANGYSVPNVNPRDLGLSGSGVAAQRDAAAVYANPAALPRLGDGLQAAAAISALDIAQTWDAPVGPATASTQRKLVPPGEAFVAYGATLAGTRTGFGAGFNVPFGGNVYWNDDWQGRFRVTTVDRKVYGFYANGAFEAGPYLRLGGGFVYYYTTEYLRQAIDFTSSEGWAELSASGGAPSFQVAAEIQPTETIRIGFDYKHKATQLLKGDAAVHGVPTSLRPSLPDQSVEHELTIPNVVDAALSWQARPELLFTFGYTFERYHVYQYDLFAGSAGTQVFVPHDYGNGYTVRVGAEYRLLPALEVRAGALRDVSGMSSAAYTPALPDASSWAGSVGASWRVQPAVTLDAAFFLAVMDRVRGTGFSFPGTYDTHAWIFSLGATWRPASR